MIVDTNLAIAENGEGGTTFRPGIVEITNTKHLKMNHRSSA